LENTLLRKWPDEGIQQQPLSFIGAFGTGNAEEPPTQAKDFSNEVD